ncbi:MAG: polyribonucleotide nucleotidyltransferase [Fibrobacter sp.]|nr:polyribonucleotide nucleotidyltransferase [Fibrobacter sp.]
MLKANETVADMGDGRNIRFETGRLAKQAAGSSLVQFGDNVVLATVCFGPEQDADFFPLTVEYREKTYAAGRLPGGYLKREGRPSDDETLRARLIDRPIRPMFPDNFTREVQVVVQVLSADKEYNADVTGISAASIAIGLSELPFEEQVASVRVAIIEGENIINPSYEQLEICDSEMVVAGTESSVLMVEGGAFEVPEEQIIAAIEAGHEVIKELCRKQQELVDQFAKAKMEIAPADESEEQKRLVSLVHEIVAEDMNKILHSKFVKTQLYPAVAELQEKLLNDQRLVDLLGEELEEKKPLVKSIYSEYERTKMREMILNEGVRIDGRDATTVRDIEIQTGILPSAHGSSVFQRGETQALVTCTLGSKSDEQRVDSLQGESFKNYMLHYNFPAFSVGEVKRFGGVSRREIGHGNLAERSLAPVLPHPEDFPYTIRVVSEILESNGSSSMASVCGGALALMDAGVPIKTPVAGVAMGLISESGSATDGGKVAILTDITGTEDHLGDMDFKVTGTAEGITAFQMDIKIRGINAELMTQALAQAKEARLHILAKMAELGLAEPRATLSDRAPVMLRTKIATSKIRDVIGPGGAVIKGIQAQTGATLNVQDDGSVDITAPNALSGEIAMKMVEDLVAEAEVGRIYKGKVKSIVHFGAFVEILPGRDGLVHISELSEERVEKVEDILNIGDEIMVKCIGVDPKGKIKLSLREAQQENQ